MRFELYLESGPQHRKTWVFVPGLAGCTARGPTTEAAIENTRAAILDRIEFMRRHGEPAPEPEPIELVVAEHVIERKWLGFETKFFASDRAPLTEEEVRDQLRWAGWSREELVAAARAQTIPMTSKPDAGGRAAAEIVSHVAGSEWSYVSSLLGTLPGYGPAMAAIERAGPEPWEALAAEREIVLARLTAMTEDELTRVVEREGKAPRTARRMLRRLLEHEWEHVLELRARLEASVG
jgi:predicted RNase H-like HicB family nuclease/uncharacterized damage-inducible protein DinB